MERGAKTLKTMQTPPPHASSRNGNAKSQDCRDSCFSSSSDGKENVEKQSHGWFAKVCSKFRNRHRRPEKCEKCGQKNDTCRANASFISGRKHYLCEDCRVSSDNMKNMYQELCRNLSLNDPPRTVCSSTDLLKPQPSQRSRGGIVRSRSMKSRPVAAPESGYNTATSLDSSCSNGRLSPEPACVPSGQCEMNALRLDCCSHPCAETDPSQMCPVKNYPVHSKNRPEVSSSVFRSEQAHFQEIQRGPQTKVYTRTTPPPPYPHKHAATPLAPQKPLHCNDITSYDGYLKIQAPNSQSVKYVFRQVEKPQKPLENDEVQEDHLSRRRYTENLKLCYHCNKFRCIAFRAPFGNGWLCEDCVDDLM